MQRSAVAIGLLALSCGGAVARRPRGRAEEPRAHVEPRSDGAAPRQDGEEPVASDPPMEPRGHALEGLATWYGPGFVGRRTANGERFDPARMTAAHRTLPFGTRVRVVAVSTGDSVVVRINDRGPFGHGDRIIDLSRGAARRIGLDRAGVMRVRLEVLGDAD